MKRRLALAWLLLGSALMLIPSIVFLNTSASDAVGDPTIRTDTPIAPTTIQQAPSVTFTVTNTSDTGLGSLRAAIDQANTTPGADLIDFTAGLGTINVGSSTGQPLPVITEEVTIDGGSARVELNGAAAGAAAHGLAIFAPRVTVRGLVINRFSLNGVLIQADNCIIQGNFIGTDAAGTAALANAEAGVLINGLGNLIGGTAITARNVISGNGGFGIEMNSVQASNNTIQGNFIGTDMSGTTPVGNNRGGVRTLGSAMNNTIGGTVPGAANIIANNAGSGVNIFGGLNNAVLGNSIFSNGVLGIDLSDDGVVTPNDMCDGDGGANNLQNFPVLTSATSGGGNTNIVGTLNSTPVTNFRIEFFSSAACDPSGNGEGQTFIGFTNVSTPAAVCDVAINVNFAIAVPVGNVITATATDPSNNTSEFSRCRTVIALGPVSDLQITNSDAPDPVVSGSNITYTIGVLNNGPDTDDGATFTNVVPAGTTFVSLTSPGSCSTPPPGGTGTVTCSLGALPSLVSVAISLVVNVNAAPGATITNTAMVSGMSSDPNPVNNSATASTAVIAGPCTITCPPAQMKSNDPNQCGAVVTYPPPITAGPCGTVTCAPASGSFFPRGTTVVTCNTVAGPSCAFNVTVNDTQPPTITCPANVTRSTDPNLCSAVVGYAAPTVSDNCPGVGAAFCNPLSGSTFPRGTTTVNCSATDSSANTATCSFTVTVNDTQPPTITCPPNQTVAAGVPTLVNYPPPTVLDNCPAVTAGCVPPSGSLFPVGTTTVTCTATDGSANTAICTFTVTVTVAPCTITCSAHLIVGTGPNATQCSSNVTYEAPATMGACGPVTCAPPSGSVFAVGTTTISCTTVGGPSCSFTVTVVDDTPPIIITCPTGVTAPLPAGQLSAVVNYPAATATDNCTVTTVVCVPPSGSTFPAGVTLVTCTARDDFRNANRCFFFVTVLDAEPPVIRCPANVSAAPPAGQTSAVVTYPPPTATDNVPGVNVVCLPASGSTFPAGATTVTCTATDAGGNKSSCSFIVGVGGPQAKVTIPGNKTSVEFAAAPTRKPPKPKNNPCGFFTVENIGFAPLILTFDSIARTGSAVDSGRITDPNDTRFFSLNRINSDQSLTPLDIGAVLTLQPGQVQNLCAKFAALIPALAGKTTGLAASNVLPDAVTSKIVFRQNAGANLAVPILARVSTALVLVNLSNPRAPAEVLFTRSGNDITVSYAVFDSNLDVSRAKYEFLDNSGQVVAGPFEIDLAASLGSANLVRGQSFSVEQRFTGASSNPEATSVRLTVFDGETSVGAPSTSSAASTSAASVRLMNRARRVTLYLPDVKLR